MVVLDLINRRVDGRCSKSAPGYGLNPMRNSCTNAVFPRLPHQFQEFELQRDFR
jgi:hypothetical protein